MSSPWTANASDIKRDERSCKDIAKSFEHRSTEGKWKLQSHHSMFHNINTSYGTNWMKAAPFTVCTTTMSLFLCRQAKSRWTMPSPFSRQKSFFSKYGSSHSLSTNFRSLRTQRASITNRKFERREAETVKWKNLPSCMTGNVQTGILDTKTKKIPQPLLLRFWQFFVKHVSCKYANFTQVQPMKLLKYKCV